MISRAWPAFDTPDAYWKSTVFMVVGGVLGVLFVSLMRRVMVEDPELPFPESVAAAEIHKAGQAGSSAAKYLFCSMGFGGIVQLLGDFSSSFAIKILPSASASLGTSDVRLGAAGSANVLRRGWRDDPRRPDGQSCIHRRRIHHRAAAGIVEFRGRRVCMGHDGAAAGVFPRPSVAGTLCQPEHSRSWLDRQRERSLALYRSTDRRRRHARRRRVYAVPDAEQPFRGARARVLRIEAGRPAEERWSDRAVHGVEDGVHVIGVTTILMGFVYVYFSGRCSAASSRLW